MPYYLPVSAEFMKDTEIGRRYADMVQGETIRVFMGAEGPTPFPPVEDEDDPEDW